MGRWLSITCSRERCEVWSRRNRVAKLRCGRFIRRCCRCLPIADEGGQTPASKSEQVAASGVAVLSGKVTVSQRSFDGGDGTSMPTLEVVTQWNQMVMTLDRLERMLYRAA